MYQKSCMCVCANVNINKWEIQIFTLCKFPCTFWCWEIPVHLRQRNWQYMSQLPVEYIEYTWDYMSIKASTWGLPMVVLYLGVSPFHFPRERVVLISWYELSKSLVPGDTGASAVQLRSMHDAQWCTTTWSILIYVNRIFVWENLPSNIQHFRVQGAKNPGPCCHPNWFQRHDPYPQRVAGSSQPLYATITHYVQNQHVLKSRWRKSWLFKRIWPWPNY